MQNMCRMVKKDVKFCIEQIFLSFATYTYAKEILWKTL